MGEESLGQVRINALSVFGALLGLVSLTIPWFAYRVSYGLFGLAGGTHDYGLLTSTLSYYGPIALASLLFVMGTLVAFGSPAGGILQASGIVVYFAGLSSPFGGSIPMGPYPIHQTIRIELGTLVGVLSVLVVLVSLLLQVWINLKPGTMRPYRFVTLIASAPQSSGHEEGYDETEAGRTTITLANSVCLAGAFLGLLSFAIPWMQTRGAGSLAAPLGDFVTGAQTLVDSPAMVIGAICFLVGSLLAFVSVAGGLVQLAGIVSFLMGTTSLGQSEFPSWHQFFTLAAGFYLGVTSAALVVFSIVLQSLLHRKEKGRSLRSALFVWHRVQPLPVADRSANETRSQLNILGFIGAIIGVIALLVSWESIYSTAAVAHFNPIQLTMYGTFDDLTICSLAFMIGTVIALLTPVGGVIQIASSFGFLLFMQQSIGVQQAAGTHAAFGIGPFLGLLSGLLVLRSLWFPEWLRLRSGLALASPRFFVVSAVPRLGNRLIASLITPRHRIDLEIPAKHSFSRDVRINIACLAGAFSGLVACGLSWSQSLSPSDLLKADLMGYGRDLGTSVGGTSPFFMIFFCGCVIALVSTLGCALQLTGLLGFVFSSGMFHGFLWEGVVEWGFGLAVISFLLIVASVLHPWGPGDWGAKNTLATRLMVWGGPPSIANEPPSDGPIS